MSSNVKDKLTASVRRAKAAQPPAVTAPAAKSASRRRAPAKPAPAASAPTPPAAPQRSANFVEDSHRELFPKRVWPD
ncbi:MAG: hypothetical protein N2Z63_05405 [Thiobacillaceae bacterium]|nr:hypothetical protein [Thiobacillaceae bacterium]